MAHGPDTLLYPVRLAEWLLEDGERIQTLGKVRWKKLARNNVSLTVHADRRLPKQPQDVVFDGSLITSRGRVLHFFAEDNGSPISERMTSNPYAAKAFCADDQCVRKTADGFEFVLHALGDRSMVEQLNEDPALAIATLAEIVTLGMTGTIDRILPRERTINALLGGLRDLSLPDDMGELLNEGGSGRLHIRFSPDQIRQASAASHFVPFEYRFSHQKDFSSGFGALKNAE